MYNSSFSSQNSKNKQGYRIDGKAVFRVSDEMRIATVLNQFRPDQLDRARSYANGYGARILIHDLFDTTIEKKLVLGAKTANLKADALLVVCMVRGYEHAPIGYAPNEI